MILAGDIGGTKSHFGLFDGTALVAQARIDNAMHPAFASVLDALLRSPGMPGRRIDRACLAVAGPIGDDGASARLTNLPWTIRAADVAAHLDCGKVRLANDFAAAALGAVTAAASDLVSLQAGLPLAAAPRLVVGAGTGLGMAIVLPDAHGWRVIPGEGGHVGFAPTNEEQLALWRFLHARGEGTIWERVVAGPGLAAIHDFLGGGADDPGAIAQAGLADAHSRAGHALRLFVTLYGSYAGDMAMTCLPRGGIYLAGGIAGKILPAMQGGAFVAGFQGKTSHGELLARMPIHVATDPLLALRGAALLD